MKDQTISLISLIKYIKIKDGLVGVIFLEQELLVRHREKVYMNKKT